MSHCVVCTGEAEMRTVDEEPAGDDPGLVAQVCKEAR